MRQTLMPELTRSEVEALRWGDADFLGFYWAQEFADPTLVVRIKPANSETVELVCRWACKLEIDVDYRNHVGPLLAWDVEFRPLDRLRWSVVFDLASHGSIRYECDGLTFRSLPRVSAA